MTVLFKTIKIAQFTFWGMQVKGSHLSSSITTLEQGGNKHLERQDRLQACLSFPQSFFEKWGISNSSGTRSLWIKTVDDFSNCSFSGSCLVSFSLFLCQILFLHRRFSFAKKLNKIPTFNMRYVSISGSFKCFPENIIQRVIRNGYVLKEKSKLFPNIF